MIDVDKVRAIDIHTHAEVGTDGHDPMPPELREASARYFRSGETLPTATDVAAYYRERQMAAVVFTVDYESVSGRPPVPDEEVAAAAAANPDVLIPFASIDRARGRAGAREVPRLVAEHGVRGFKFHPNLQAFFPNDRDVYPIYEAIAEAGVPALFHTGHSGIGSGLPGGGGIRLKYANPMYVDDVVGGLPGAADRARAPVVPVAGRGAVDRHAQAVGVHRPVRLVAEVLPAAARPVRAHAAQAAGAVRLRLPDDHARPLAEGLRAARIRRRDDAADPQGQRRAAARAQVGLSCERSARVTCSTVTTPRRRP